MQPTILEIALLVVLTQIPTAVLILQNYSLRQESLRRSQNSKSVVQIQSEMLRQVHTEKQDLLNRFMAGDIKTYTTMTHNTSVLTSLTSDEPVEVFEKPVSMSDAAEWARENGYKDVDEEDLSNLSNDVFGLGSPL